MLNGELLGEPHGRSRVERLRIGRGVHHRLPVGLLEDRREPHRERPHRQPGIEIEDYLHRGVVDWFHGRNALGRLVVLGVGIVVPRQRPCTREVSAQAVILRQGVEGERDVVSRLGGSIRPGHVGPQVHHHRESVAVCDRLGWLGVGREQWHQRVGGPLICVEAALTGHHIGGPDVGLGVECRPRVVGGGIGQQRHPVDDVLRFCRSGGGVGGCLTICVRCGVGVVGVGRLAPVAAGRRRQRQDRRQRQP